MAKRFTLLAILWIAAAFVVSAVTAEDPTTTTTTAAPPANTSPPVSETSTATNTSSGTAPTKDPDATSKPPTSSTATPPNACDSNPCGAGSTCEPRVGQSYVCLCLPGDYYNSEGKTCGRAKAFPGQLQISGLEYSKELEDKRSAKFETESKKITSELDKGLEKEKTYIGSTVLAFRQVQSSGVSTRDANVEASVEINYSPSSTVTQQKLEADMEALVSCAACPLKGSFTLSDLCASHTCDIQTTACSSKDGSFNCACKDGYIKTDYSTRICLACPSGQKAASDSECVPCPFGYSGLNCGENWRLVLVIVGSVLGALLLITLIILPVVAMKSKKKSKKSKNEDIGNYVSHSPAKAPLVNGSFVNRPTASVNGPANVQAGHIGVPRIPRATSNNNWDNRNNLEMTPSNSRQNLVPGRNSRLNDDQDDAFPYSQNRPQSNPYAQSRPQSNPYAQNRASTNPYAERQGHSNPYYTHDDGRRF